MAEKSTGISSGYLQLDKILNDLPLDLRSHSLRARTKAIELAELIASGHPGMIQGIKTLLHEGTKIGYEDRLHLERDAVGSWMKPVDPRDGFVDFLTTRKSK